MSVAKHHGERWAHRIRVSSEPRWGNLGLIMANHRSAGVRWHRWKRHAPQKSLDNRADRGPVMGSVRHLRRCGRACRHSPRGRRYDFAYVPRGLFCAVLHRAVSRPRAEGADHHNLPIHWLDRYRLARRPCMEFFVTTPKALRAFRIKAAPGKNPLPFPRSAPSTRLGAMRRIPWARYANPSFSVQAA